MNTFISRFTPDGEVKVDAPVKFIKKKEEIAIINKIQASVSRK